METEHIYFINTQPDCANPSQQTDRSSHPSRRRLRRNASDHLLQRLRLRRQLNNPDRPPRPLPPPFPDRQPLFAEDSRHVRHGDVPPPGAVAERRLQERRLREPHRILQGAEVELGVVAPLLLDAADAEGGPVVDGEVLAVARRGQHVVDEIVLLGVVVALGEVAPGHGDVVLDGAVAVQLVEVQARNAACVDLALGAQGESPEYVHEWIADEGPEAGRGVVLVFEVDGGGEELAEGDADAEVFHGGFHFGGADVAAVARDVAVVGEGVDDGAGTADVGGGGGAVFAFAEKGGGFVG